MTNVKNIVLITSITVVLGFGIIALQTNSVSGFVSPTDDVLNFGENVEITPLSHTPGHKGPLKADETFGENRIKCSLGSVLKCTVINSGDGLERVKLHTASGPDLCDDNETRPGAGRGSVDTRRNLDPGNCDYQAFNSYILEYTAVGSSAECRDIDSSLDTLDVSDSTVSCPP